MTKKRAEDLECGHCKNIFPTVIPDVSPDDDGAARAFVEPLSPNPKSKHITCPYCKTQYYHHKGKWYGKVFVELKMCGEGK